MMRQNICMYSPHFVIHETDIHCHKSKEVVSYYWRIADIKKYEADNLLLL